MEKVQNYQLMINYINAVDKFIKDLESKPGAKPIIARLIKLQEITKDDWAQIHSIVRSLNENPLDDTSLEKQQDIILKSFQLNLKINKFYDQISRICEKKSKGDNKFFVDFLLEELYFNYSIYLDAMHLMGTYYVPSETFPFVMSDLYLARKFDIAIKKYEQRLKDEEES